MADFVTIAGTAYKMLDFSRLPDEVGGKMQRTLSGQRRGGVLWRARQWQGTVFCETQVEAEALILVADDLTPRLCGADALPAGGVTCHVEHGASPYNRLRTGWWRSVPLTFREVVPA